MSARITASRLLRNLPETADGLADEKWVIVTLNGKDMAALVSLDFLDALRDRPSGDDAGPGRTDPTAPEERKGADPIEGKGHRLSDTKTLNLEIDALRDEIGMPPFGYD